LTSRKQSEMKRKLEAATDEYYQTLEKLVDEETVTQDTLLKMQIAMAKWGDRIQLDQVLNQYYDLLMQSPEPRDAPERAAWLATKPTRPSEGGNPQKIELKFAIDPGIKNKAKYYKMLDALNTFVDGDHHTFVNGRELALEPFYNDFLSTTIEVMSYPSSSLYDHVELRIGTRIYSVNGVSSSSSNYFDPHQVYHNQKSNVFLVNEELIQKYQLEIERYYDGVARFNVPPFDGEARLFEVDLKETGRYVRMPSRILSGSFSYTGKIRGSKPHLFIETADGTRTDLIEKKGKYFIQTYNCAVSAWFVADHYFEIEIPWLSARSISAMIKEGHPQALLRVDYQRSK
jgi:hypothetical protein